jgi:hypothetical protein
VDDSKWDGVDGDNKKRKGDKKMKKYIVIAQSITQYELEVSAKDEYEALDKAANMDGAEWSEDSPSGDWEILRAEEVTK